MSRHPRLKQQCEARHTTMEQDCETIGCQTSENGWRHECEEIEPKMEVAGPHASECSHHVRIPQDREVHVEERDVELQDIVAEGERRNHTKKQSAKLEETTRPFELRTLDNKKTWRVTLTNHDMRNAHMYAVGQRVLLHNREPSIWQSSLWIVACGYASLESAVTPTGASRTLAFSRMYLFKTPAIGKRSWSLRRVATFFVSAVLLLLQDTQTGDHEVRIQSYGFGTCSIQKIFTSLPRQQRYRGAVPVPDPVRRQILLHVPLFLLLSCEPFPFFLNNFGQRCVRTFGPPTSTWAIETSGSEEEGFSGPLWRRKSVGRSERSSTARFRRPPPLSISAMTSALILEVSSPSPDSCNFCVLVSISPATSTSVRRTAPSPCILIQPSRADRLSILPPKGQSEAAQAPYLRCLVVPPFHGTKRSTPRTVHRSQRIRGGSFLNTTTHRH